MPAVPLSPFARCIQTSLQHWSIRCAWPAALVNCGCAKACNAGPSGVCSACSAGQTGARCPHRGWIERCFLKLISNLQPWSIRGCNAGRSESATLLTHTHTNKHTHEHTHTHTRTHTHTHNKTRARARHTHTHTQLTSRGAGGV